MMKYSTHIDSPDVILIGTGIMSANLGAILKCLAPSLSIQAFEVADDLAQESSNGWNNAGTGHAGICELSYTPKREADGSVDVKKLIEIFEQFEQSKQFWAYAVSSGMVDKPEEFINPVPHISFVHGSDWVAFLKARYEGMVAHHFFRDIQYSTCRETIESWAPLLVEGRGDSPIAATKMDNGTDVNFGMIARKLLDWLSRQERCGIACGQRVTDLTKRNGKWDVTVKEVSTGKARKSTAAFVFVGAGGGSLPLLQRAGIPEAKGLGGFPIGGQWLICERPEVVTRHMVKVYGQPLPAAPTMAVPHLDTRILDGKRTLLFGPFASWTTRFLQKKGSLTDLPRSVKPDNLFNLLNVGLHNLDLVGYLIQQGTQSMQERVRVLRDFYPGANVDDWKLIDAGIRVQAIKETDGKSGIVHYGTEVLTDKDCSISALLGASPGASVSVNIVLEVVKKCFPQLLSTLDGAARMKEMIPGWNESFSASQRASRFQQISQQVDTVLGLSRSVDAKHLGVTAN